MTDQNNIYAYKIYTGDGVTKENIFTNGEKVLHIGPGKKSLEGADTIDALALPGVDIVHDLDSFPWPCKDNEYDVIFAHNVFEHLSDQVRVMEEMWRILKPRGRVIITVPYFRCVDAFTDSTHKHFFTASSLDYYLESKTLAEYEYSKRRFRKVGFWYGWARPSKNILVKLFKNFIGKHPKFYDQYLSLLIPVRIVTWELEVIKS